MASRSSSGRTKNTYTSFDSNRPANDYSSDNLKAFIKAAKPESNGESAFKAYEAAYKEFTDNLQLDYARQYGLNPSSSNLGRLIMGTAGASGAYKADVSNFNYNYVLRLYNAGRLRPLSEGGTRTIEDVDKQPMNTFSAWFREAPASQYNTNALVAAATKVGVPNRTNLGKGMLGVAKKEAIYNAILDSIAGVRVPSAAAAAAPLEEGVVEPTTFDELSAMNVKQLRALARLKGVARSSSLNKQPLIDALAEILNFQAGAVLLDEMEIAERVNAALARSRSDIEGAKQIIRDIGRANLESSKFTLVQVRDLAKALGVKEGNRTVTTKSGLIKGLGLGESSRVSSTRATRDIKTDLRACKAAAPAAVRAAAESLNIPFRTSQSVDSICDQIYAAHLLRMSNLLLNRLEGTGALSLAALAALRGEKLNSALGVLQRNLSLPRMPADLADLIRMWLNFHYEGRARQLYPDYVNDVSRFIASGVVPVDSRARQALAIVFSDLRPDLYRMTDAEIATQLGILYNNVVSRIALGNVPDLQDSLAKFGFASPSAAPARSRSPSPLASPRARSLSPAAAARPRSPSPRNRSPVEEFGGASLEF